MTCLVALRALSVLGESSTSQFTAVNNSKSRQFYITYIITWLKKSFTNIDTAVWEQTNYQLHF